MAKGLESKLNNTTTLTPLKVLGYGLQTLGTGAKYAGLASAATGFLPAAAAAYTVGILADGASQIPQAAYQSIRERSIGKAGIHALDAANKTVLPGGISHALSFVGGTLKDSVGNAFEKNVEYMAQDLSNGNMDNLDGRIIGPAANDNRKIKVAA